MPTIPPLSPCQGGRLTLWNTQPSPCPFVSWLKTQMNTLPPNLSVRFWKTQPETSLAKIIIVLKDDSCCVIYTLRFCSLRKVHLNNGNNSFFRNPMTEAIQKYQLYFCFNSLILVFRGMNKDDLRVSFTFHAELTSGTCYCLNPSSL